MKWLWTSLAFILAIILVIIMKITRAKGDNVLQILDSWKNGLQKKITVINERQKKREMLIKIMEKNHAKIPKNVKSMSDDDIDKYITAYR